jgi:hypothetical protein
MSHVSFALLEAFEKTGSVDAVATRLNLPATFVAERVEAARLCLLLSEDWF